MEQRIMETTILRGTTYTNEALMKTADILMGNTARPNKAKPIVIVFTDGFSGEDPANGARLLREMGATVYVVGVNKRGPINRDELEVIAGHPSRVYTIHDIAQLQEELRSLSQLCLRTNKAQAL
ncbi:hypothetical protein Aduo_019061 [Ancylostoma duodenale]